MNLPGIRVRGAATAEELAAVLAAVATADRPPSTDPHRQWRTTRLAALRRTGDLHRALHRPIR